MNVVHVPPDTTMKVPQTGYSFDGGDYVSVWSTALSTGFVGSSGSMMVVAQIPNTTVWSDTQRRVFFRLGVDANNFAFMHKLETTVNEVRLLHRSGGANSLVVSSAVAGGSSWFQMAQTWDQPASEFKAYLNGTQTGLTQAIANAWVGTTLTSSNCILGATNEAVANPHIGGLQHAAIWPTVLTAAQISSIYNASSGDIRAEIMGTSPLAYWMLGEAGGTTAASETGAQYNGVLGGGTSSPTMGVPGIGTRTRLPVQVHQRPTGLRVSHSSTTVSVA